MEEQNVKEKYLICQITIKILKQHAIRHSSLQNINICSSKGYKKTSQIWIMYVAYIAILEHQISAKDITSDYGFLLRLVKTFAVDTEEYPLPKVLQDKWCEDFQKPCSIILRFVFTNHMYAFCVLAHWFSAVYYDIWLERYQIIFISSSSLAKGQ